MSDTKLIPALDPTTLPKHFDSPEAEKRLHGRWQETKIYDYDASRPREETFVVDTPPPTVSGSLHMGHVFSYTHADVMVRYKRMRGFNIFYPMGWDDNGLPTERRVQNYFHVRCDTATAYEAGLSLEEANAKTRKYAAFAGIEAEHDLAEGKHVIGAGTGGFNIQSGHVM